MLKTNSKKARENIRAYIMENQNVIEYGENGKAPGNFPEAAREILNCFRQQYFTTENEKRYYNNNEYIAFISWTQGLPGILNTDYYLCRACKVLGAILEEQKEEIEKYNETQAENLLTHLIYHELKKGENEK